MRRLWKIAAVSLGVSLLAAGCGYTEQEWQAQLDKYQRLSSSNKKTVDKLDRLTAELDLEKQKIAELEDQLRGMGLDVSSKDARLNELTATISERERALADYRERTKQLEATKARFELLRSKLSELDKFGIEVKVRRNRMVVSLPGDVLFDSGKDKLKAGGKEALTKIATVLSSDSMLAARDYQVAGHTDSKTLAGGPFQDNWGLSAMRARQVLLFLTDPARGKLPATRWSAAGYADTDPVASNDSDDGRKANRRCDIVVMPNLDEMLDLKSLANAGPRPLSVPSSTPMPVPSPTLPTPLPKPTAPAPTAPAPKPTAPAPTTTAPAPKPTAPTPVPKPTAPPPKPTSTVPVF